MEYVFLFAALFYLMYFRTDDATNSHWKKAPLVSQETLQLLSMAAQMSSQEFSATWVKYSSNKSRRNFTEIHLATCLHLDATCLHLDPFASKDEFVTFCPLPLLRYRRCSNNAQIGGTSAAGPTEEPADFWELEVGRILFVLPTKCCSATTSSEGCLLLVTSWTKKIWGRT